MEKKIQDVYTKLTDVSGLVRTSALTAVKNAIPIVSDIYEKI